jgi:hypothetical protein
MLLGAALFGQKSSRTTWAAIAGGLIPDIPMYAIVGALKWSGVPDFLIFAGAYFHPRFQIVNGIAHSLIAWPLLAILGWRLSQHANRQWPALLFAAAASATLHAVTDLFTHREDAHMHFWPVSTWKFMSPVSYWNPMYHAQAFHFGEAALAILSALYMMRTFNHWLARSTLAAIILAYGAALVYFNFK